MTTLCQNILGSGYIKEDKSDHVASQHRSYILLGDVGSKIFRKIKPGKDAALTSAGIVKFYRTTCHLNRVKEQTMWTFG